MTRQQVELIQQTWPAVELVADQAASVFYARLFAIDPEASALFAAADMRSQRQKLMLTLREIVSGLTRPEQLVPGLDELGRRHAAYGVRAEHYVTVGEALLWMLDKVLGPAFTQDVRAAWTAAYDFIAAGMQGPTMRAS